MDKLKAVAVWLSSKSGYILAALALATAAASAGATCFYTSYQPKVTQELIK